MTLEIHRFDKSEEPVSCEFPIAGVISPVIRHHPSGEKWIDIVIHNKNSKEGIREGDIGLPSESSELKSGTADQEPLSHTVRRLLAQEYGMRVNEKILYVVRGHSYYEYLLPRNPNAGFFTPSRAVIIPIFENGHKFHYDSTLLDLTELRGTFSAPLSFLLHTNEFKFRRWPDTKDILRLLDAKGVFQGGAESLVPVGRLEDIGVFRGNPRDYKLNYE